MVIPTTSQPSATSRAAATDESTPPLMPTTIRSAMLRGGSRSCRAFGRSRDLVPHAEQVGQTLELLRRRVADLDLTLSLVADDSHARHQRALQRLLQRCQLDRSTASLPWRQALRLGEGLLRANGILGRPDGPVVSQDLIAQTKLLGDGRQCEKRTCMAHREAPASEIGLDLLRQAQKAQRVRDRRAVLADP